MTEPAPAGRGRIDQLDGLRALAFLLVFLKHAATIRLLGWGVDVFFALSGFLITGILLREPRGPGYFRRFYLRRAFRILPAYLLVVALAVAFFPGDPATLPWYLAFVPNVRAALDPAGGYPVLFPTWSLGVEEQFYLLWPLLMLATPARGFWRVPVAALVLAPLARFGLTLASHDMWPTYVLLPSRIDTLAIGALLAWVWAAAPQHVEHCRRAAPWVLGGAVALFAALAALRPTFRTSANDLAYNVVGYALLTLAAGAVVCAAVSLRVGSSLHRVLASRPLRFLGTISYMMYLVHELVLALLRPMALGTPLLLAAGLAGTIAFAAASWVCLEAPLLRRKDRWVPRGATPIGAAAGPAAPVGAV